MITLEVLGTPAPKGSSRAFVNKKTGRAFVAPGGAKSTEVKIASWNVAVRQSARDAMLLRPPASAGIVFVNRPLKVEIVFRMARPAGHYSKATGKLLASAPMFPSTKPDIDKLARTTLDAMTGSIFDDDSRIASLHLDKRFAEPGHEGALITIADMAEPIADQVTRELETARKVGELFGDTLAKAMYP